MGARVALHVALAHPDLLRRLVLVSGTGGIDDAAERAGRRASDGALAVRIEKIGTDAFLAEWLAQPMFRTLPPDAASLDERRRNSPTGLADSLRHSGTGTQEPLWDRLVRLDVPALVVTGDLDTKFTALGERLAEHLPRATHVPVADAGHTVHLEAPATFVDVVRRWLAETA
jgi:2-succinyl-6-hydroxy-2,4-cyclohexadiene-1-carboxylate synthase